ncbi:phosphoribosyltransferase [Haematobacter massiliensis]|nr:phosphoribosyltransferase [Haematobacter massiliensis]
MEPHDFWQEILPPDASASLPGDTYYTATLADGRRLRLPIRPLPDGRHGLASLIINQASFAVLDALATDLAAHLADFEPDVVVGLPTLGLTLAAEVARKLGHTRYVPLGTSRKFWYAEALSVPLSSVTTPDQVKRLYMDPRMLPLLQGRRVALIDDVISSGRSIRAGLSLLEALGIRPVVLGAAMLQSDRWRDQASAEGWSSLVRGCFTTPLLERNPQGRWC